MTLTFYHAPPSAPSRGVLLTLLNLGVEFDINLINLAAGDHKTEEFTKLNPQQKVPTLDDDGFVMSESRAIMGYLVDSQSPGNSLYPSDPKARFIIDHRLYYDATVFSKRLIEAIVPLLYSGETSISQKLKDNLTDSLDDLEGFLEGQEWFSASENVSIADLALLAAFASLYHVGQDISSYPNITAWYERCSGLPGFAENEQGAKALASSVKSILTEPY